MLTLARIHIYGYPVRIELTNYALEAKVLTVKIGYQNQL